MTHVVRVALVVAVLLGLGTSESWAGHRARDRYRSALRQVKAGKKVSLESVYALGGKAASELTAEIVKADEARASGRRAAKVDPRLEGFQVSTEEALYAVPDPAYFAALAGKRGGPVDVAFFALLGRTGSPWPAYIDQQTDVGGCTMYDNPELLALYQAWTTFAAQHPGRYAADVAAQLAAIEHAYAETTCACGKADTVRAALEAFLAGFPSSPAAARVKARLDAVRAGTSDFHFQCVAG